MTDPWAKLREFTQARIGLGRAGYGVTTDVLLDFQLAHASARDAVHLPWDMEAFAEEVGRLGLESVSLSTQARDRQEYLKRPDRGRALEPASRDRLTGLAQGPASIALIFSNGLSSAAIEAHGLPLLEAMFSTFREGSLSVDNDRGEGQSALFAPVCLVPDARVALADEIGAILGARLAVIIVGERPGLSAADSLGAYLTYHPHPGNTDAERNCISNIRPPEGIGYQAAATKLLYLCQQACRLRLSGVALKDDMPCAPSLDVDLRG